MSNPYLLKAVEMAGGQSQIAGCLNGLMPNRGRPISQAHVWKWLNNLKGQTPPAEYVIPIVISVEGKVTPHQLRPDLYPDETWLPVQVRQKVEAA